LWSRGTREGRAIRDNANTAIKLLVDPLGVRVLGTDCSIGLVLRLLFSSFECLSDFKLQSAHPRRL